MNLHAIAGPVVAAVNPQVPVGVQLSDGYTTAASRVRTPAFQTPGALVASIAGLVLTATVVSAGKLAVGQQVAGAGVTLGTTIVGLGSGTGGAGTYAIDRAQVAPVSSEAMTSSLTLLGQIQAMTFRDLQQLEGLNLNGTRRGIYFNGRIAATMRWSAKGGDLLTFPDGSVWLTAMVLEQWPDWCKIAATQQNVTPST